MTAHFELRHIPARVVMSRTFDESELRFVGCASVGYVDGEFDFEEFHRFAPFDLRIYLDTRRLVVNNSGKRYRRRCPGHFADFRLDGNGDAVRRVFRYGNFVRHEFDARIEVEDFDVPGLPVEGFVVKENELGGFFAGGDDFALGGDVEEGGYGAVRDFDDVLRVTEFEDVGADFFDGGGGGRVGGVEGADLADTRAVAGCEAVGVGLAG
jgi:hypothetical protein